MTITRSFQHLLVILLSVSTLLACNDDSEDDDLTMPDDNEPPAITPTPPTNPTITPLPPIPSGDTFTEFTDPSCNDGQYRLVLPRLDLDYSSLISDVRQNETKPGIVAFTKEVLSRGYPYMYDVIANKAEPNCFEDWWWDKDGDPNNPKYGWENNHGLIVHECGHEANGFDHLFISDGYDLRQPPNDYFHRREITEDEFHNNINGAINSTYLSPDTPVSAQGLQTSLDEWTEYIHSVMAEYQLYESGGSEYHVKYLLNWAWFAPRYFLWAKNNYPNFYAEMMHQDDGHIVRESVLTLWGATWALYDAFEQNTSWSPSAEHMSYLDQIRIITNDGPVLLDMMNEIRQAHGCLGIN